MDGSLSTAVGWFFFGFFLRLHLRQERKKRDGQSEFTVITGMNVCILYPLHILMKLM